jgi:hypothetical protein
VTPVETLMIEREDATRQALDALARYKFWMFGYHAARVVYLGTLIHRIGGPRLDNPFRSLVVMARDMYCRDCGEPVEQPHRCTSESLSWVTQEVLQPVLIGPGLADEVSESGPRDNLFGAPTPTGSPNA